MERVGVLTGGGDCPGLNAVIRAVTRRSLARGAEVVGVRAGWRGLVEGKFTELGPREISGILPRGGTIIGTSRTNPYKTDGGPEAVLRHFADAGLDLARRDRRRGHARRRGAPLRRARVPGGRGSEDDRQRPVGHRLHVRVRHGGDHRDRGDRPAAHDGRVAQPRHGRRGHGPPHRLDRRHERHRRGRRRDPHPRAADDRRGVLRRDPEKAQPRQGLLDRGRERGLRAHVRVGRAPPGDPGGRRRVRPRPPRRRRRPARQRDRGAHRLRDARDRARPRPARGNADRARPRARDALRPQGRRPRPGRERSGRWPRSRETRSWPFRWPTPSPS